LPVMLIITLVDLLDALFMSNLLDVRVASILLEER